VASSVSGIAFALTRRGRLDEALALHRRALACYEKALGPDARKVGITLDYVADTLRQLGRYAEARPLFERGLAIHRKLVGDDHEDVAEALALLAELDLVEKRWDAALAGFGRARDIWEKIGDEPSLAQALMGIGGALFLRGDARGALAPLERALALHLAHT